MKQVVLTNDNYNIFIRAISILKDLCSSLEISNGIIRQRTDNKLVWFEIDLSSILGDINIIIPDLRLKIDLLKLFNHATEVIITESSDGVTISDINSKYFIQKIDPAYLDNKFTPVEELEKIYTLDKIDLILSHSIDKKMCDRIKTCSISFETNIIRVQLADELANMIMISQGKDQRMKLFSNIKLPKKIDGEKITVLYHHGFTIDHDGEMDLEIYFDSLKNNQFINYVISSQIGLVPVKVYGKNQIKDGK